MISVSDIALIRGLSLKQGMGNRGIRESGNPGIGESGNRGIRESGNNQFLDILRYKASDKNIFRSRVKSRASTTHNVSRSNLTLIYFL